ncbi:hypothetical protein BGZ82_005278 [Podila clonocystis]|nr:hypothetical protein BGZ82_005278 [Podila clonocystis]
MSAMNRIPTTSGASRVETLKNEVAVAKNKVIENKATMENLLADVYSELRALCQTHVISGIENSNAVETLIHVGTQFPEVKEATLDYIARIMDTMFADGDDPFAPFVQQPKCHEILVEVMLRSRMADSKRQATYISKGPGSEDSLEFNIRFSNTSAEEQRFELNSDLGSFAVLVIDIRGKYTFKNDSIEPDFLVLNQTLSEATPETTLKDNIKGHNAE